jgi:hypothetical protein
MSPAFLLKLHPAFKKRLAGNAAGPGSLSIPDTALVTVPITFEVIDLSPG